MTDPRGGEGFAICNRDFDPFASPRPRAQFVTRRTFACHLRPLFWGESREQGAARTRTGRMVEQEQLVLAKQAKEVAGYLTEVGYVFSV
jgi:hypothetical protein